MYREVGDLLKLTLCMIVKNEEDCISRCLNSVKDIVDEIIVVDTGSTDKTIEIAKSFNVKLVQFQWNGSFSDARNYGLKHASGDWILWLDADEELEEVDKEILEEKQFDDYDVLSVQLINYYGDHIDPNNTITIGHTRLFRNNGIQFINKMHEHLDFAQVPSDRIGRLDVTIHHYGYLNPVMKNKSKTERNIKMLKQQIDEGENVYWAHYFIALEHYNNKEYVEALKRVNIALLAFLEIGVLPPSMVYKLKYSILVALGEFEEAIGGIDKALLLYRDYVDLHYTKGIILYYLDEFDKAIRCFEKCIDLGEDNPDYLILKGVGSFHAWHYIGLCQLKLKKKRFAAVSFLRALLEAPTYKEAIASITLLVNEENTNIEKVIDQNFKEESKRAELKEILKQHSLL